MALYAHAPSDTFLSFHLTATNLTGQWEIKLADLQHALGFDKVDAAAVTGRELRLREEALALDTMSGLTVKLDGAPTPLKTIDEQMVTRRDGESLVHRLGGRWRRCMASGRQERRSCQRDDQQDTGRERERPRPATTRQRL